MLVSGVLIGAIGMLGVDRFVLCVSVGLEVLFAVYFTRHLSFAISAMRSAQDDLSRDDDDWLPDGVLPRVTVLVACRNEEAVVETLVDGLLRIDYPAGRHKIVLVDDGSTDRTGEILDEFAQMYERLTCVHRPEGLSGGKSGALNAALGEVDGDVVVVFDADHRPHPDVIRKLVRHFRDPSVGAVQGRCLIRNADDSLLSRAIWVDYLGGYLVTE